MIANLSLVVHAFIRGMSTSLSVDKMLLPGYVNFRGLSLEVEIDLLCLKHINSVLFVLI